MRALKNLANAQGLSLIEIIVAMALLGAVSLGVMKTMQTTSQMNTNVKQNLGAAQVRTTLMQIMRNEEACTYTMLAPDAGAGPLTTFSDLATRAAQGQSGIPIPAIYTGRPDANDNKLLWNTSDKNTLTDGLIVKSITLKNYFPSPHRAEIHILIERPEGPNRIGGQQISAFAPVFFRADDQDTNKIVDCVADQGSMKALACSVMGGWYDAVNTQKCFNINVPFLQDAPDSDGNGDYGITSVASILIQSGSFRVGNEPGGRPSEGFIVASRSIISEAGDVQVLRGNLSVEGPASEDKGNITASNKITGRDIHATRSLGVGMDSPEAAGRVAVARSININTPESYTGNSEVALQGNITLIPLEGDQSRLAHIKAVGENMGSTTGDSGYVNVSQPIRSRDFILNRCSNNEIGIITGNDGGVKCVPSGRQCANTDTEIFAMVGHQANGEPLCESVLKIETACPAGQVAKGIVYTASGGLRPECCTPVCPNGNTYCSGVVVPAVNGCPATCNEGNQPAGVNSWNTISGGSSDGSGTLLTSHYCQGTCSVEGANTGRIAKVEMCQAGVCGGDNSCVPGTTRDSFDACQFTCEVRKVIEEVPGSYAESARGPALPPVRRRINIDDSNGTPTGELTIYVLGGGGAGASGHYNWTVGSDGGNGGKAGELQIGRIAVDQVAYCEVEAGAGAQPTAGEDFYGRDGEMSHATCYNSHGDLKIELWARGGRGGQDQHDGLAGRDGERAQAPLVENGGHTLRIGLSAPGRGVEEDRSCSDYPRPGYGSGGGGGKGQEEAGKASCPGGPGVVVIEYGVLDRPDLGPRIPGR